MSVKQWWLRRKFIANVLYRYSNAVFLGKSEKKVDKMVNFFGEVCRRKMLQVNIRKSQILMLGRQGQYYTSIMLDGMAKRQKM